MNSLWFFMMINNSYPDNKTSVYVDITIVLQFNAVNQYLFFVKYML